MVLGAFGKAFAGFETVFPTHAEFLGLGPSFKMADSTKF